MSGNFYPTNYNHLTYREDYSLNDQQNIPNIKMLNKPKSSCLSQCAKIYTKLLTIINIFFIITCSYIMLHTKIKEDDTSFFNIICLILALTRFCSLYNINQLYNEKSYSPMQFLCYLTGEFILMSLGIYFVRISKINNFIDISFKTQLDVTKICMWSQLSYGLVYVSFIIGYYCYFDIGDKKNDNNFLNYA